MSKIQTTPLRTWISLQHVLQVRVLSCFPSTCKYLLPRPPKCTGTLFRVTKVINESCWEVFTERDVFQRGSQSSVNFRVCQKNEKGEPLMGHKLILLFQAKIRWLWMPLNKCTAWMRQCFTTRLNGKGVAGKHWSFPLAVLVCDWHFKSPANPQLCSINPLNYTSVEV